MNAKDNTPSPPNVESAIPVNAAKLVADFFKSLDEIREIVLKACNDPDLLRKEVGIHEHYERWMKEVPKATNNELEVLAERIEVREKLVQRLQEVMHEKQVLLSEYYDAKVPFGKAGGAIEKHFQKAEEEAREADWQELRKELNLPGMPASHPARGMGAMVSAIEETFDYLHRILKQSTVTMQKVTMARYRRARLLHRVSQYAYHFLLILVLITVITSLVTDVLKQVLSLNGWEQYHWQMVIAIVVAFAAGLWLEPILRRKLAERLRKILGAVLIYLWSTECMSLYFESAITLELRRIRETFARMRNLPPPTGKAE